MTGVTSVEIKSPQRPIPLGLQSETAVTGIVSHLTDQPERWF